MPSQYSTECSDLCRHAVYRTGCMSCCLHDYRSELAEAIVQRDKASEAERGYAESLAQSDLVAQVRMSFQEKKDRAAKQFAAWSERAKALQDLINDLEQNVKDVCATTEPNDLSTAFESLALEREEELVAIWRAERSSDTDGEFINFKQEDPGRKLQYKGLDRSKIPATPDCLVSEGTGLQVFLKHGKAKGNRLPTSAIGHQAGPAIMSYGRAITMFGEPEGPGIDSQSESEPSATPTAPPRPKTEEEFRLQSGATVPLLSAEDQWALFGPKKFMGDTALLARQYAKLVAEKEQASNIGNKNESSGKRELESAVTNAETDSKEWPPVENLDWAGFTNWIHRCKQKEKRFGLETLKTWNKERQERLALCDEMANWKPPKDFDDGSSRCLNPRKYYKPAQSPGEIDLRQMGVNTNAGK